MVTERTKLGERSGDATGREGWWSPDVHTKGTVNTSTSATVSVSCGSDELLNALQTEKDSKSDGCPLRVRITAVYTYYDDV